MRNEELSMFPMWIIGELTHRELRELDFPLITTRTEEQANTDEHRAFYNATDMNRVEFVGDMIAEGLTESGYDMGERAGPIWTKESQPTDSDKTAYLARVADLARQVSAERLPPLPSGKINWEAANNIEKRLYLAAFFLALSRRDELYSGDLFSGEV